MAQFDTGGLDVLIHQMADMGEEAAEASDEILLSSAEIIKTQWKKAVEQAGHRDTGGLISHIGYAKKVYEFDDVKSVHIYPSGTSKTSHEQTGLPSKYSAIAFRLNYGTSKIPGSRFVEVAETACAEPVRKNMEQKWGDFLKQKGLI